jgi:hypothetical protein
MHRPEKVNDTKPDPVQYMPYQCYDKEGTDNTERQMIKEQHHGIKKRGPEEDRAESQEVKHTENQQYKSGCPLENITDHSQTKIHFIMQ